MGKNPFDSASMIKDIKFNLKQKGVTVPGTRTTTPTTNITVIKKSLPKIEEKKYMEKKKLTPIKKGVSEQTRSDLRGY